MLEIHNFTQNGIDEKFFQKATKVVLKMINIEERTEISLAIVGDGRMRKLNKMYRGRNRVTDVLAFENKSVITYLAKAFPRLKKGQDIEFIEPPDDIRRLGEIIICYPRAKKQAKRLDHSLEKELTILLIHGILHLLGHEHENDGEEAEEMEKMEKKILTKLNYG
ncbi:MAG: rRNA maturation RNase YbeY [Parcubacteria group bacterium]|nr:rRNA maturation RNase YbeY [Parcubacteria group bacterium]